MTFKDPIVFIVDNDEDSRRSIISLVKSIQLNVWSFARPQEFLDTCDSSHPGCLITDIRMPGMSGPELQNTLAARNIELPVIFHTAFGDIPTAVQAMKKGAFDFLEKPCRPQLLIDRIQQAVAHDQKSRQIIRTNNDLLERFSTLTDREREVMRCVVEGKANKVIAMTLGLSQKTVEFHRAHVMEKMKADSVAQLVRLNIQLEIIRENPRPDQGLSPFSFLAR